MKYLMQTHSGIDLGIYAGESADAARAAAAHATGRDPAYLSATSLNDLFVVGILQSGPNGSWFELADERGGVEANLFKSREAAENTLKSLGWAYEIYPGHDVAHLL